MTGEGECKERRKEDGQKEEGEVERKAGQKGIGVRAGEKVRRSSRVEIWSNDGREGEKVRRLKGKVVHEGEMEEVSRKRGQWWLRK